MRYFLAIAVCILALSCSKPKEVPDIVTGLTVNISLDNGSAYDSVTKTTGTVYGANNYLTLIPNRHGEANKAVQFSRNDSSYIDMGDLDGASFLVGSFTISCWVKVADSTHILSVLSKRTPVGPFEYSLDNHFGLTSFKLDNWVSNGGHTVYGVDPLYALAPIVPNTWQHIAFVGDGKIMRAYLNGYTTTAPDMKQEGFSFSNTSAPLVIGNGGGYGANNYFDGAIDDIRIYNRALDAIAIQALAQQ